ncbi:Fungal Zn(2)-Cys(6) binuclear cluster domain-containing protein [Penicillium ucsense]|uniref:Fungal Zn(2)-Cys(6) binuclear cluster domain-containing protein n=1 Tax=Penicillium ucsense TaxID=2839758 RepID=A0A8J8W357_9EURO|nr:Fungal Zn(2)-Cys(6) binuclear cluster domain-containing protein [Penicillium ucsense]KAF7734625.1 Fungal Zn(2)-Cys(6) binuclear cluster domain-containing protein [Penicillium ucsense]
MSAIRLAACEACRKAKLACDHQQPVCARCQRTQGVCIYRTAPFKRRRVEKPSVRSPDPSPSFEPRRNPYPNPGYLGSSSHAAIFKHITPSTDGDQVTGGSSGGGGQLPNADNVGSQGVDDNHLLWQGAEVLRQLLTGYSLSAMKDLVLFWLAKGANLALAEPFVAQCAESVTQLFTSRDEDWHLVFAQRLLQNSAQPLRFDASSDLKSFAAQFLNHQARWETLGIFFAAVSRATIDIPFFPLLYNCEQQQFTLRRLATKLCDFSLEISLSLDCLNDLQLTVQYENFIVHSYVDGDQSYRTWRKLGDVISSTFALGYHENVEAKPQIPPFLMELRKTAFARIYSADKNIAIFLGRPPRMTKRFCYFQIPSDGVILRSSGGSFTWNLAAETGYRADTCWSALCASLKEEIWELLQDKQDADCVRRASIIQQKAEQHWQALPPQFRLEGSLKQCAQSSFSRDFLAHVRLNHLHVLFLLRLLLLSTPSEPDNLIVQTAGQMLALVVELILLRDQLTNSGTGLIWKVAYYGLPAAGIILLALLKQHSHSIPGISQTKSLRDLSVFVAEVQIGTLVKIGDPNYALLSKATHTIQKFLDSFNSDASHPQYSGNDDPNEDWAALLSQDLWDFEAGFWQNLADHPSLLVLDPPLSNTQ